MSNLEYFLPVLVVVAASIGIQLACFVQNLWGLFTQTNSSKFVTQVQIHVYGFLAAGMLLWILLPSTPSFSTFGYPHSTSDIQTQEQQLKLLQEYNRSIVGTTNTVKWFIFFSVLWMVSLLNVWKLHRHNVLSEETASPQSHF